MRLRCGLVQAALLARGRTVRQAKLFFYAKMAEKGLATYERDGWGEFPTQVGCLCGSFGWSSCVCQRVVGTGLAMHECDGWGELPIQEGCRFACTALPTQHSILIPAQRPLVDPCLPLSWNSIPWSIHAADQR